MSKHVEISVKTEPVWEEYLSNLLIEQIGCCGVVSQETEYKDEEIIKDNSGIVKGYLWLNPDNPPNFDDIQNQLWQNKQELIETGIPEENIGSWKLSIKEIEDEEWAHSWKKYWHPMKIGSKIVIRPTWEEYNAAEGEIIIDLDPGTAFGTGTHPTTRLCIMALEKYLTPGDTLADVGMGSGILAIAGVKLGAKSAIGVDNDPSVIEVADENAEKNNVADKCTFYEGVASDVKGEYEVVVSNILAHILIETMQDLEKLVKPQGKLILSGIIAEKSLDVQKSAVQNGFEIIDVLEEENWVAIVAKK